MLEEHDKFRIYGLLDIPDIDLEKSILAGEGVEPDYKDYIIKGRVLNAVKDDQGEVPIIPEMDWSYFDQHGFVKYEHDPVEVSVDKSGNKVIKGLPANPGNIIGAPISRMRKSDKEEYLEAGLFPEMDKARDVVKLIKSIREWNRRYPNRKRTLGYSIEGNYIKKSKGGYAGRVVNVVVTPNPRDYTSYVSQAEESNRELAKSLSAGSGLQAGYSTAPQDKTGGETLKKESLEGSNKSKNKSGEKKMDTSFVAYNEAFWHFKGQGLPDDEAKKEAEKYFSAVNQRKADRKDTAEKSITTALEHFQKSIKGLATFQEHLEERELEVASIDKDIKKSIAAANEEDGEVDGAKLLSSIGKALTSIDASNREGQLELAKSIATLTAGVSALVDLHKSMREEQAEINESVDVTKEQLSALMVGIKKSMNGVSTDPKYLNSLNVETRDEEKQDKGEMLKSITSRPQAIRSFLVDRGAAEDSRGNKHVAKQYFDAEHNYPVTGFNGLDKSIQKEVLEQFGSNGN